jgi:acyl-CoA synthetase (AMP-forming)/AMP-acid ligase II
VSEAAVAAPGLDRIIARSLAGDPDELALTWQGRSWTWGWVRDAAARLESELQAAGMPKDLPVGFIPRVCPEAVAAFLSMMSANRSMTMIYSYQTVEAMAADVRKLRPAAVVANAEDWTTPLVLAAREIGAAGISLARDGSVTRVPSVDKVGPGEHRPAPPQTSIELLTSGTTGPPKRYPIPFEQFRRCMLNSSFELGDGNADKRPAQITVPIANISGIYGLLVAVALRRPIMLENKFTLEKWLEYQRKYRPANIGGPPAIVKMILDADVAPEDLSGAKFMSIGMGPVDPVLRRQFEAKYGIPILPCYGATEFVGAATAMTLEDHHKYGEAKFGSVGRGVRGVTLRIRDQESGEILPAGSDKIGLVEVLHDDIGPEWIRTTDLGRLDADGFLYLHGRADGVINRGGFKIHPSVIESALMQHPAVAFCSVVGLPHERLGWVPAAAIELKPGAPAPSVAEIDAFLRQRLPATNIPTDYRIVDELPRTPSLKIRLDAVKALFAQGS